jgi:hypothetical protein
MNEQLTSYIKEQTALGVPKETIIQNLKDGGGWSEEEVQQVFAGIQNHNTEDQSNSSSISKIQGALLLALYTAFSIITAYKFIPSWAFRNIQLNITSIFLLVVFVIFSIFYLFQIKLFFKKKYQDLVMITTFPVMFSLMLYSTINPVTLLQMPIFLITLIFLKKRNTLKIIFILQIIFMSLFLFMLFLKKDFHNPFIPSPDIGAIPCVTGVYNPATKLCE